MKAQVKESFKIDMYPKISVIWEVTKLALIGLCSEYILRFAGVGSILQTLRLNSLEPGIMPFHSPFAVRC